MIYWPSDVHFGGTIPSSLTLLISQIQRFYSIGYLFCASLAKILSSSMSIDSSDMKSLRWESRTLEFNIVD